MKQQQKGITVFYSYVEADRALRDQLATHLSQLKRDGLIEEFYDQQILAGEEYARERDRMLRSASLILLLISSDFLASDACYQDEMQYALERHRTGMARVVPIIVRPCDWQYSPFAHLQCLPRSGKPIAISDNQDQAFLSIAKALRRIITGQPFLASPLSNLERQNRSRLLKRVRDAWIKGLLEQSLHQAAWIDLHLQEQPDALENPWQLQVQELGQAPHPLPIGTNIVQVYDEANGELLILGEPGSGKTTLLLHLARTLLDRAFADERLPMPVVFNLSSWAQKQERLALWLVEELQRKYYVPHKIGQDWIEADQVLPLLDGLDEVTEDTRKACIQAIAAYYDQHPGQSGTPIVVCCRTEEYRTLFLHLPLQRAVSILPLSDEQVETYFSGAQEQLEGFRHLLSTDDTFAQLMHRPLMLNIAALAFQGKRLFNFPSNDNFPSEDNFPGISQEKLLQIIFAAYIERMLTRRGRLQQWKQEQFHHWLHFLAKQLRRQQQTAFLVEDLQLGWLPEKHQGPYLWSLRLLGFLFAELFFGLSALLFGSSSIGFLCVGFVPALLLSALTSGEIGEQSGKIYPVEVISWILKGVRGDFTGVSVTVLFGTLFLALTGALIITQYSGWLFSRLVGGLFVGLLVSLLMLAIGLSMTSDLKISLTQLTKRFDLSPNEGIRRSGRNGLLFGGLCGGLALLACELTNGLTAGLFAGLLFGLMIGFSIGLNAFVQHYVLRFWLWRTNCLPWRLVPFLDEATERLLLHKVGGSYIFVHRLLLEYFAALDEPVSTDSTPLVHHEEG